MTKYKVGESINCPHCGEKSVVKMQKIMDGWTYKGEAPSCALCGEALSDIVDKTSDNTDTVLKEKSDKLDKLASFLGTEQESTPDINVLATSDGKHFCKDCKHYFVNPFKSYCLYHERDTEPMQDCPDFTPKQDKEEE